MKRETVEQSEAKTESMITEDIPAWYPLYSVTALKISLEIVTIEFGLESHVWYYEENSRYNMSMQ